MAVRDPATARWHRVPPAPESLTAPLPGYADGLSIVFQPILRAADLSIAAYEALSRFEHAADVSRVYASAHTAGHGDLLEVEAVRRALGVPERPPGTMLFVNVSERAMRSARFWTELPVDLTDVMVELHETRAGLDEVAVNGILDGFRERGARICLDDVGVHAQDLARIESLRPDVIKIDRRWVDHCDVRRTDVIDTLIAFAIDHGAVVCAEGAERPEELAVLRDRGVELVQGFLLAEPESTWHLVQPGR
jgi:EAL domain-containing protein (putative c-di-GMP-specific phosphodiesterase class I)